MKKKCFSYIRYSSAAQHDSHSQDRQLEIAPRVAKEKGWELDESLNHADLGISGHSGSNKGTIESIIAAAESGAIPVGTVCILEALDRLTRLSLDEAYQLFRRMLKAGIEVYTDRSGRHMTKADLNNPTSVMLTVVELDAGFQFSEKLSDRVGKAWRNKRTKLENGERLTKKVPGWINAEKWTVISDRADVVRRIFNEYVSGKGISMIVKGLNSDKIPTWGLRKKNVSSWNSSYVSQLLHSRSVIGEFTAYKCEKVQSQKTGRVYYNQGTPTTTVENYYPAIVDKNVFFKVKAMLGDSTKVRKTDGFLNLYQGVAFCKCGARMYHANGYYMCWSKLKGNGCKEPSMLYRTVEMCMSLVFMQVPEFLTVKKTKSNDADVDSIRGEVIELQKQVDRITEFVIAGKATNALVQKQADLETQIAAKNEELEMAKAKVVHSSKTDSKVIVKQLVEAEGQPKDKELRRRINAWCLANLKHIQFHNSKGYFDITSKADLTIRFTGTDNPAKPPLMKPMFK